MKRSMKILLVVFTLLLVITNLTYGEVLTSESILNEEESTYGTRFSSINLIQCAMNVGTGKVGVEAVLDASTGDNTKITAYLQKYDNGIWRTVKTMTKTASGQICILDEDVYTTTNYEFRVKLYAYVYNGSELLEKATMYEY